MRKSMKMALATSALAVAGGLFLFGSSYAERGFGGPGGHGPMGGPMGGFGAMQQEMLKGVDTNGDGALSQDEINAAIDARFTEFDADKNGSLSLEEFQALWAEITKPMSVRAFQFLDRFDRNGDGMLSPDDHPHRGSGDHGPRRWSDDGPRRDGEGPHGRWWNQDRGDQGGQ